MPPGTDCNSVDVGKDTTLAADAVVARWLWRGGRHRPRPGGLGCETEGHEPKSSLKVVLRMIAYA